MKRPNFQYLVHSKGDGRSVFVGCATQLTNDKAVEEANSVAQELSGPFDVEVLAEHNSIWPSFSRRFDFRCEIYQPSKFDLDKIKEEGQYDDQRRIH